MITEEDRELLEDLIEQLCDLSYEYLVNIEIVKNYNELHPNDLKMLFQTREILDEKIQQYSTLLENDSKVPEYKIKLLAPYTLLELAELRNEK